MRLQEVAGGQFDPGLSSKLSTVTGKAKRTGGTLINTGRRLFRPLNAAFELKTQPAADK